MFCSVYESTIILNSLNVYKAALIIRAGYKKQKLGSVEKCKNTTKGNKTMDSVWQNTNTLNRYSLTISSIFNKKEKKLAI